MQGMFCDWLEWVECFIDDVYIVIGKLFGVFVQVWWCGELVLNFVLGLVDCECQVLLVEDLIFCIYLMIKFIMLVVFMMLVEECKVVLDDLVSKFIFVWVNLGVYVGGFMEGFQLCLVKCFMCMVDLLCYIFGLIYGFYQNMNVDVVYCWLKLGDIVIDGMFDEMIEKLVGVLLEFFLGEVWNYFVFIDVFGYLVGKISGMLFEIFLKEWIFDLLGMVDMVFYVLEEKVFCFCVCYVVGVMGLKVVFDCGLVLQDDLYISFYLKLFSFIFGGGGLVFIVVDYLCFLCMLLQGGELDGVCLLGLKMLVLMMVNYLLGGWDMLSLLLFLMFSEVVYDGIGFGLGFVIMIL